ncbi:hypothetical protein KAJ27_22700 [bacterium]|nr:hypothetical protein [bacterium]
MKKIIIFAFILASIVNLLICNDFADAQIVSINTNTVSAKFLNGKIYRVIDTSQPISVQLRKNFRGKWKRRTITGGQAVDILIKRGYFLEVKNGAVSYYAATKSYRSLADPADKYNRTSKLHPTFKYYYPVTVTSREALPGNDERHYNYYSPTNDRWHSVPYYNDYYPRFRNSILNDSNYYRSNNRYYPPGYYGTPYSNW